MNKRKRIPLRAYSVLRDQVLNQLHWSISSQLHYQLDLPLRNKLAELTEKLEMIIIL